MCSLSFTPHKQPQYRGQSWRVSSTECGRFLPLRHWDGHWREQVDCLAGGGMQVPTSQASLAPASAEIPGPNPGSTRRQGDNKGRLGHASAWAHEHSDTHTALYAGSFNTWIGSGYRSLSYNPWERDRTRHRGQSEMAQSSQNLSSGYFPQGLAGLEHSCQGMAQATSDHVENLACCFDADGSQEDGSYIKGLYALLRFYVPDL